MTRARLGSAMSDKQIARAAVKQCLVTFRFGGDAEPIEGYVIGMDDFHWNVAHIDAEHHAVSSLIHKGLARTVTVNNHRSLSDETETFQNLVSKWGTGFWRFCNEHYFGHAPQQQAAEINPPRQEQPA